MRTKTKGKTAKKATTHRERNAVRSSQSERYEERREYGTVLVERPRPGVKIEQLITAKSEKTKTTEDRGKE
jgi:hypothetical protein